MDDRINILNADLREAVRNGEITEKEADVEFKATTLRWENEAKLEQAIL